MSTQWDLARRRREFKRWRQGRPFSGGLLLIVSGIELLLSANLDLGAIEVHLGYEGFLSYLLPALMMLTGVFVWVSPKQRVFYGIIGTLTAVYSLIGLNLGGFFIGMLLGMVGGALAFAWSPPSTEDPWENEKNDEKDGDDPPSSAGGPADTPSRSVRPAGQHRVADETLVELRSARPSPRPVARWAFRLAVLVVIAAGLVPAALPTYADTCPPAAANPSPTASPTPTPSPTETHRSLWDLWVDFWTGRSRNQPAAPPPSPSPTASPVPTCTPAPGGTTAPAPGGTTAVPGTDGASAPNATPSPGATSPGATNPGATAPAAGTQLPFSVTAGVPIVAARPALMTTTQLTLEGFAFQGATDLQTANGPLRVLHISADRATNDNFRLRIRDPQSGTERVIIESDPLEARGSAQIYTTRFEGTILGIPVVLTPDLPLPALPITLPVPLVFTNVTLELVFLDCQVLDGPGLRLRDPTA